MRVISLALFRHPKDPYEDPRAGLKSGTFHRAYLPATIRAYRHVFQGWEIRIHHDDSAFSGPYGEELRALGRAGIVRLVSCGRAQFCESMLWRLKPMWDPAVEVFLCRDLDACPTQREKAAIDEWLASPFAVHAMADSTSHSVPLMGGMIGFKRAETLALFNGSFPKPSGPLDDKGDDQRWLGHNVWPVVHAHTLSHRWQGREWPCGRTVLRVEGWDGNDPIGQAVGRHIGSAYQIDKVLDYFRERPDEAMDKAETESRPAAMYAVISSDMSEAYAFFLPLTAELWKRVVGFQPFVYLVGTLEGWLASKRLALAYTELSRTGARIQFLGTPQRHRTSTVAQVSRLYAGDILEPTDWAITADVDMWPLNRAWYQPQSSAWHLWYANAYGGSRWPLCYLGAPVSLWREVMGQHQPGQTVLDRITEQLDAGLGGDEDGWKAWNYDEDLFAAKFHAWPRNTQRVEINRSGGPPRDRIDRSNWPAQIDLNGKVDAHVLRPGPENWDRLRPIIAGLLGAETAQRADGYVAQWKALA